MKKIFNHGWIQMNTDDLKGVLRAVGMPWHAQRLWKEMILNPCPSVFICG